DSLHPNDRRGTWRDGVFCRHRLRAVPDATVPNFALPVSAVSECTVCGADGAAEPLQPGEPAAESVLEFAPRGEPGCELLLRCAPWHCRWNWLRHRSAVHCARRQPDVVLPAVGERAGPVAAAGAWGG